MKFSVKQENLKNSLNLCSHFISSKTQLPILGNVLLKTSKTKLFLASTNLETSVSTSIGAKIEKEGEITVPGKIFTDIVSNLSSELININVEKEKLIIESSGFKSGISVMNSSDFPTVPMFLDKKDCLSLKNEEFINIVDKCLFCVSNDDTRPVLTGVLFLFEKNKLRLVSTDGFRLSSIFLDTKETLETEKVIIPKTILNEISKNQVNGEISLSFNKKDNQVVFGTGDTVFSSRVIEGDFPDFEKIIPKSFLFRVSVDKYEIEQAVRLASVFAKESGNTLKIKVFEDKIKITSESNVSGSQEMEIDASIEKEGRNVPKGLEIAFNYKFIEDFLKNTKGDNVVMEFTTPDKPVKFLDPKLSNFLHLIMPIRIQS